MQVAKGADMFISVWNLHRSPEYWDHPNSFDPSRFDASKGTPNEATEDFAYLPFGGGRRKCIGAPVRLCAQRPLKCTASEAASAPCLATAATPAAANDPR